MHACIWREIRRTEWTEYLEERVLPPSVEERSEEGRLGELSARWSLGRGEGLRDLGLR